MEKLTMSVPEMAQALGISRAKGYDLVNRADFPKLRLGRKIVVPTEAFHHWLAREVGDEWART